MKNISKTFLAFFVMMIVTAGILSLFENDNAPKTEIGLGQLAGKIKAGEVEKIEVRGNELKIFTKDKKEETAYKRHGFFFTVFVAVSFNHRFCVFCFAPGARR